MLEYRVAQGYEELAKFDILERLPKFFDFSTVFTK